MSIGAVRDWTILRCPSCRATLVGTDTSLQCSECAQTWPVRDGVPALFRDSWVRGNDRLMRHIYDALPSLHDPAVTYMLPLWQLEGSEGAMRNRYLCRIELEKLQPRGDGQPVRLLEVCIGTGVNRGLVQQWLPKGLQVDYWGVDLSEGMMAVCKKKLSRQGYGDVQMVMADAHALPFADASFDRVFHVGAIGNFSDPGQAMTEMARVAQPGTPIVVVDEQLERDRSHNLWADRNCKRPSHSSPNQKTAISRRQTIRQHHFASLPQPNLAVSTQISLEFSPFEHRYHAAIPPGASKCPGLRSKTIAKSAPSVGCLCRPIALVGGIPAVAKVVQVVRKVGRCRLEA
ncbi:MAG: methyltransferase domain-containing protein, partial [Myxococcales bacterium]|nr:methyltransferase domain-containing protein [Myxococcales bacterium]